MATIHSYLSADHRHCDECLANLEVAASKNKWDETARLSDLFCKEMNQHFECEENVLFPAFEEKTGSIAGPTSVMRMEHVQMRKMLDLLPEAIQNKNVDRLFGITETLMIYIQQHNSKEEQMLYNMCDSYLASQVEELVSEMEKINT